MYREAGARHNTPHFHAYYQEDAAIFSIEPIEMARGALPKRQRRLVEAWAELHQQELLIDWERLHSVGQHYLLTPSSEGDNRARHTPSGVFRNSRAIHPPRGIRRQDGAT